MKKKLFLRLCLTMAFLLTFYSCVHDEVYSSSDPSSTEYTNKSLWKQDEKYIKNVKTIFEENSTGTYFTTNYGTVYWDYALTMGSFDESFLEVPVVKDHKVSFVLIAIRDGNRVYFKRKSNERSNEFFNILIFKDRNQLTGRTIENSGSALQGKNGTLCYTQEIIWEWTNEDGSSGPTYTFSETYCFQTGFSLPCQSIDSDSTCGGASGPTGSGDGGGYPYPQTPSQPQNPCEKLKTQNQNADFKTKVANLKTKTGNSSESGFRVGNPVPGSGQTETQYQELSNKPGTNELNFTIFNTTYGIMHSHYDGLVAIFSPGDINLFIQLLKNAQANNIPLSDVFLTVVTIDGVYQLRGDSIDVNILNMYTDDQIKNLDRKYLESMGNPNISKANLQKEFLKFIKENMNIDGAKLYETDSNGNSKQLLLNGNNLSTPNCP